MAEQAIPPTWEQVLDGLADDTLAVELALLRGDFPDTTTPWQPPMLPPLPVELAGRARAVLERQLAVQDQLRRALDQAPATTRRRAVSTPAPQPVLLDMQA